MIEGKITERLITASDDFTMYLWEPSKSTKPIERLKGHAKAVNHVTFSPDGLYIASSGWDNHVKLWRAQDGKYITSLRGHVGAVYMSNFSPDSRFLVSGSKDTTLKVWDVNARKLKEDLPGHQDEVFAVVCIFVSFIMAIAMYSIISDPSTGYRTLLNILCLHIALLTSI